MEIILILIIVGLVLLVFVPWEKVSTPTCKHEWKYYQTFEETLTHKYDGTIHEKVFKSYECIHCQKTKRVYI